MRRLRSLIRRVERLLDPSDTGSDPEQYLEDVSAIVGEAAELMLRSGRADLHALAQAHRFEGGLAARSYLYECLAEVEGAATDSPALTIQQASRYSGISARTLYRMIQADTLPHVRVGTGRGSIRIKPATLDRLLQPEAPPKDYLFS